MISMPTAEQIALVAAKVAVTASLMEVVRDGELTVMPLDVPLQLLKPEEQKAMDDMVQIACTLYYYNDEGWYTEDGGVDDMLAMADDVLHAWAEEVLGE